MESIELELLNMSHVDELVVLYAEIFDKKVAPDYFIYKYGLAIDNSKHLSIVGLDKGKVIGFFGALKQEYRIQESTYELLHAGDYYIQKEYRGKGVFDQLYFEVVRRAEAEKMAFLYAYTSEQTAKFSLKHNWEEAPNFLRYEMYVFPQPIKSILERVLGSNWSLKRLTKNLKRKEITLTPEVLMKNQQNGMIYDADYLEMKKQAPRFSVNIAGCQVWLKYEYRITIGWIHLTDTADLKACFAELKRIARRAGIHHIVIHVTNELAQELELDSFFPANPSFRVFFKQLDKNAPNFSAFPINFINGDIF